MSLKILQNKRFCLLWLASVVGAMVVLPYAFTHANMTLTLPMAVGAVIQAAVLYLLAIYLGLRAADKLDLKVIPATKYLLTSVVSGVTVGGAIKLLDFFVFKSYANIFVISTPDTYLWQRILASFYGAINEEVLLRLFAVSVVALILLKITRMNKSALIIFSIFLCSLLFGLGHLPMLYKMTVLPNPYDIVRVLLLNGFAGIVFGVLYFRFGLLAAMLCHFAADIVIHVM